MTLAGAVQLVFPVLQNTAAVTPLMSHALGERAHLLYTEIAGFISRLSSLMNYLPKYIFMTLSKPRLQLSQVQQVDSKSWSSCVTSVGRLYQPLVPVDKVYLGANSKFQ